MKLHTIPALTDNYIWLLEVSKERVIVVDPGEAQPVIDYLNHHNLTPIAILLTHHHHDHIDGVTTLNHYYSNIAIYGPKEVTLPINYVSDLNDITIDKQIFHIINVPGHTKGHIAYYCQPYLFCGDTIFSAGCGRVFEGRYQDMYQSICKLKQLPNDTIICPGHEYTISNLRFAHSLLPDDQAITAYYKQMQDRPITLPTTMEIEKKINLFLRCDEQKLQQQFHVSTALDLFKFFRTQKDIF